MGFIIRISYFVGILFCISNTVGGVPTVDDLSAIIYQVDERNSIIKVLEDKSNTDVVIENIDRIRLECSAPYPIQWIYTGTGVSFNCKMFTITMYLLLIENSISWYYVQSLNTIYIRCHYSCPPYGKSRVKNILHQPS